MHKSCCEPAFQEEDGKGLGATVRKLWRGLKVVCLFTYASIEVVLKQPKTRQARAAWLSNFCARVLKTMDVVWSVEGPIPMHGAVISNHLTYLDILVHAAMRPCVFVSKIEMKKVPVLGWMTKMSGTVYVARGQGGSALKAAEGMQGAFDDGLPVVFFPEGTTGVGDALMPFRSGLLAQAIETREPITPGFLTYSLTNVDLRAGRTLRDDVHWGPQSLGAHLWNFLSLHEVRVVARFAETPIAFSGEALEDRKVAAVEAHAAVQAVADGIHVPATIG